MPECQQHTTLVTYLYGECEPAERARFEAHLEGCAACADDLRALTALRGTLGDWGPPDARLGFRLVAAEPPAPADAAPRAGWWARLQPAWGLALAAAGLLAVAASLAGVEAQWGDGEFAFRVGRTRVAPPAAPATAADPQPWRAELVALEQTLRRELAASPPAGPPVVTGADEDLRRELRELLEASERRQQQAFASSLLTLAQEFDLQRREDQLRMQQEVGSLEDYLVRVSGR